MYGENRISKLLVPQKLMKFISKSVLLPSVYGNSLRRNYMSENYINTGYNLIKNMKGYSLHPCVYYSSEMSYDTKNIFLLYF